MHCYDKTDEIIRTAVNSAAKKSNPLTLQVVIAGLASAGVVSKVRKR